MSPSQEELEKILRSVENPLTKKDIVSDGTLVSTACREDGSYELTLALPRDRRLQLTLDSQIRLALSRANFKASGVHLKFVTNERQPKTQGPTPLEQKIRGVQYIVAIGSGKGGVGKSTVAVNLASMLSLMGKKTGILDADIYGPSVGKMLGLEGKQNVPVQENMIIPLSKHGLKIMSFSFLLEPEQAVIWRGPMLARAIQQFLYDVAWQPLDFLIVDLPPGTGDAQLSLAQQVHSDGAILVTTPQSVSLLDAGRALTMFSEVNIPVLGVIENMSEFLCPHCRKSTHIFGEGGGAKLAKKAGVPLLGQIPLTIEVMESGEKGIPIVLKEKKGAVFSAYEQIAQKLVSVLKQDGT
ncbi:MAG: Mrp/NBP35 family ATP-binding protein [Leptospiraceae bacterium]|nr:Mrp/NBP35 family ATP-binding protein [Leptospiraceae bacterium]MDW8307090.1 Mrp/NBP35 family ATP-binding protein [Leptospiraceae bacterium]